MDQQPDNSEMKVWGSMTARQQMQVILFWIVVVALIMGIVSAWEDDRLDWRGLGENFSSGLLGSVLTFILIDRVIGGKEKEEEKKEELELLRKDLIRRMGSKNKGAAILAVEELKVKFWHKDIVCADARLVGVDLEGMDLAHARLPRAVLNGANLSETHWSFCVLQEAWLVGANLQHTMALKADLRGAQLNDANLQESVWRCTKMQGAILEGANLQRADLSASNLQNADLNNTKLQGAILRRVNLQDVQNLETAEFNSETILPDGSHWTPESDLARFTDPSHPNFWRSDDPNSPAYRGKADKD